MSTPKILFVDDEEHLRFTARQSLELEGLNIECFTSAQPALAEITRDFDGILITDIRLPGMDGLELMRKALQVDPHFPVILITGHGDVELAVSSMQDGAYDFLEKPYAPARLIETVKRALDKRQLTLENRELKALNGPSQKIAATLHGNSTAIRSLRDQIEAVAKADIDLLVYGETGVGKEVACRAIHNASLRATMPFVHINCGALPSNLVESELFGHEAGAFHGAIRTRIGRFEAARGGTVLLDEIDSLSPLMQTKLLHAIQNRVITRLGSNEPVELNVRFIGTTKKNLEEEVSRGAFRADLFYRLNTVTLKVPSLNTRREDIPVLFSRLIAEAALRYGREIPHISNATMAAVSARDWPGNVRELRSAADRYMLGLDVHFVSSQDQEEDVDLSLLDKMAKHEKSLIMAALTAANGNITQTYQSLQISRKSLYEKMQKYGLSRKSYMS